MSEDQIPYVVTVPPEVETAPNVKQLVVTTQDARDVANKLVVSSPDTYNQAAELISKIAMAAKRLEDERLSITRPMDAAKKRVMDWFRGPLYTLDATREVLRKKMVTFTTEQNRLREEERQRAEAAARQQREEAARLVREEQERAQAEQARLQEEQRQAEQLAQEAAQRAAAATTDEDRANAEKEQKRLKLEQLRAANRAEQAAEQSVERVEQIETTAIEPLFVPQTEVTKAKGIAQRKVAKYRINDLSKINANFMVPDEKAIGAMVRSMGTNAKKVIGEGIEIWLEDDLTVRAKS